MAPTSGAAWLAHGRQTIRSAPKSTTDRAPTAAARWLTPESFPRYAVAWLSTPARSGSSGSRRTITRPANRPESDATASASAGPSGAATASRGSAAATPPTAPEKPAAANTRPRRLDLEQRVEPERLEVDGTIHDAERHEKSPDPRLSREDQSVLRPAPPGGAEGGNRQEHVTQRSGMGDERQGRRSASAASWRRPFVASAELE